MRRDRISGVKDVYIEREDGTTIKRLDSIDIIFLILLLGFITFDLLIVVLGPIVRFEESQVVKFAWGLVYIYCMTIGLLLFWYFIFKRREDTLLTIELFGCASIAWWVVTGGPASYPAVSQTFIIILYLGFVTYLTIGFLLLWYFYLRRTKTTHQVSQRNKGIFIKKIIPASIPLLLGFIFLSMGVGGTIGFIYQWYVFSQIEIAIILPSILIFIFIGVGIIILGLKWLLKSEKNPVANPRPE